MKANEKSNALIEKYDYISKNDSPDFMIQIEIFNKLADETNQDKIFKLSKEVNHVNLVFEYKEKKVVEKLLMILQMQLVFMKIQRKFI